MFSIVCCSLVEINGLDGTMEDGNYWVCLEFIHGKWWWHWILESSDLFQVHMTLFAVNDDYDFDFGYVGTVIQIVD
jgi:hypothetical protein